MTKYFIITILLVTASVATAKSPSKRCSTLKECTSVTSIILGHKYFSSEELKGKVVMGKSLSLNKKNADRLFSEFLNLNGYTRVHVSDNIYKIVNARDIRYMPIKSFNYKAGETINVPDTADYYMLSYGLKTPENGRSFSRSFRPFMSRYGRIIEVSATGKIIIQDTGINLRRLISLLDVMDVKLDDDQINRLKAERKRSHEIALEKAKYCKK